MNNLAKEPVKRNDNCPGEEAKTSTSQFDPLHCSRHFYTFISVRPLCPSSHVPVHGVFSLSTDLYLIHILIAGAALARGSESCLKSVAWMNE